MHISTHGVVTRSIHASYWGNNYAVYSADGGYILARLADGHSLFFQGDDAAILATELVTACDAVAGDDDDDAEIEAIDRVCSEYAQIEEWSSPSRSGGAPSSDGGTFNFYA